MSFRLNVTKKAYNRIYKISVVRLIIYSYSECLLLKVKLTSPPRSRHPGHCRSDHQPADRPEHH